jgi:hypothetical protein
MKRNSMRYCVDLLSDLDYVKQFLRAEAREIPLADGIQFIFSRTVNATIKMRQGCENMLLSEQESLVVSNWKSICSYCEKCGPSDVRVGKRLRIVSNAVNLGRKKYDLSDTVTKVFTEVFTRKLQD